ncbi:GNAT family N-acetyltransferase [Vibrio barjaei]|jgi:ribosomal-protein-alanine N-acetyltransferase|uniref:GNAT family N-acetyltransferase n=1 Tax=Vibrio barjaei TaxID=1676683 RepID=UPI0007BB5795|nr:GNAT family N-acetyltransferase [Vibrio barjaei]MCY9872223.1 GNAT family N-acetyltransferase [Vibrio barjaei]
MDISLSLVELEDCHALLLFERQNKAWFEQHIPPRDDGFYSQQGVEEHIREQILFHRAILCYPMLIRNNEGEICGRINLNVSETDMTHAEVGYRVGESHAGKGIASSALSLLIDYAKKTTSLKTLKAHALTSNLASQKVLENNQFEQIEKIKDFAVLHDVCSNAYLYQREI